MADYPDTPWGHLKRLKDKQAGVETEAVVTKKKTKKKAKKKTG